MRRHISYANVVATLALVFAMSGGALAAKHYLIESTKQIKPAVLGKLRGARGAAGARGAIGPAGAGGKEGAPGKEGKPGEPGEPATRLLAAITGPGAITRAAGLAGLAHTTGTNTYVLTWGRDISQCYPVANIFAEPGYTVIGGISGSSLTVTTFNDEHAAAQEPFYVAVLC